MSEFRVPDLPALRVFDPKATRGAVIRGLVRTALVVVAFLVVASLVLAVAVHASARALGRPAQLDRMTVAFQVAHPGFVQRHASSVSGGWRQKATLAGGVSGGASQEVRLSVSIFGVLQAERLQEDPVDDVLMGVAWTKKQTASFLSRLPQGVRVDGVVVFAEPVTPAELNERNFPQGNDMLIYGPAFANELGHADQVRSTEHAVSWPLSPAYPFRSFSDWTAHLSGDDDDDLRTLGLPGSRELKALAATGLVTASWSEGRTPAELSALLKDRRIASFTPSAVRFDLATPSG